MFLLFLPCKVFTFSSALVFHILASYRLDGEFGRKFNQVLIKRIEWNLNLHPALEESVTIYCLQHSCVFISCIFPLQFGNITECFALGGTTSTAEIFWRKAEKRMPKCDCSLNYSILTTQSATLCGDRSPGNSIRGQLNTANRFWWHSKFGGA